MREISNVISLANKAGMVKSGTDTVISEIQAGHAKIVILASDASENAKKLFRDKCSYYQVPLEILLSREQISAALGKERSVVCILSDGFKNLLMKKIGEMK